MPFYTPSPMVSFNYQPAKSDARRILDTQKEIKQEQQKDQEFETDMMIKQQAYELGRMNMQKAQVEADALLKKKKLDDLAAQTFQGIIAAGGSKGDGYKAVQELYLREGGWAAGQKAKEEAANAWKEAWDMADINPAAAEEAAELANSMAPAGSPRMTAQSIMEAKKRIKAESQKPIELENGDVLMPQPDGTFKVQNFLSDFTRNQLKEERDLKTKELDIRAKGDALDYAASMANVAESKAARIQRTEERGKDLSAQEKRELRSQETLVKELRRSVDQAKNKLASGNPNERLAMIAALTGNSNLAIPGNDDANKQILQGIIDERETQLAAGIDVLATIPGGEKTAENMRKTLNTKPATSTGTPKKSVRDYSFMKKKETAREYPR
jgi:hypothetical protein